MSVPIANRTNMFVLTNNVGSVCEGLYNISSQYTSYTTEKLFLIYQKKRPMIQIITSNNLFWKHE